MYTVRNRERDSEGGINSTEVEERERDCCHSPYVCSSATRKVYTVGGDVFSLPLTVKILFVMSKVH